jgi:hypothetical protein
MAIETQKMPVKEGYSVSNVPLKFKDRDVQRVIRAARSAGLDPTAVRVDPRTGMITVLTAKAEPKSDVYRELEEFETRHGQA